MAQTLLELDQQIGPIMRRLIRELGEMWHERADVRSKRCPIVEATALSFLAVLLSAESASAHVKWFCAFNVAAQPKGLADVLSTDFVRLVGLGVLALFTGSLIEATALGKALLRATNRVTRVLGDNTELMFRAGGAFFFIACWTTGDILLTPELKTTSPAISWLQLAIAAGLISHKTMPFSALGIVFLYAVAVWQYGAFHLADYPLFLGVAAYLTLAGLQRDLFGTRPLDIVRWTAAVVLMWASVEKWAYPEWSSPLFIEHPGMNLGYDPEFFMRAAGVVEFTLAFGLVLTPLVRRFAAILLAAIFVSASFEFGKLDVIGHTLIVVALLAIIGEDAGEVTEMRDAVLVPVGYGAALFAFLGTYYGAHAALFGTSIL